MENVFASVQNGSDVRGVAIATDQENVTLTEGMAFFIAVAFGEHLVRKTGKALADLRIGIGHDSRVTAEAFARAAACGLAGSRIFSCGLVSTPSMFRSTLLPESDFDGAIMLTASHLPFNRNGMKFFTKDGGMEKNEVKEILLRAAALAEGAAMDADGFPCMPEDANDTSEAFDLITLYAKSLQEYMIEAVDAEDRAHPLAGLHVVVDAGNGASGFFASRILEPLGADISGSAFLEPDGTFPNHVPNPENETAMEAVRDATMKAGADLGVIFDCDGDRAAVVFADGTEVNRNTLIALLSSIVAEEAPGSVIVTDSITSDELTEFLTGHLGLEHLRFKRGYKNVIDKGIELNAAGKRCELAIETSGHAAFRQNDFSDDGAYICVRILIRMAQLRREGRRIEELIADLKEPGDAREVRFAIAGEDFADYATGVLEDLRSLAEQDARFHIVEPNYEGIRIAFNDEEVKGWVLLRKSLHDPVMPMNVEAVEKGGVDIIFDRLEPFLREHDRLTRKES